MKILTILIILLSSISLNAQNGNQLIRIHAVANTTDMNAISNPNEGNLIYVQSNDQIHYYDGSSWQAISTSNSTSGWSLSGNSISSTDMLGTTNNQDLKIRTNNIQRMVIKGDGKVGIGIDSPDGMFQVESPQSTGAKDYSGSVTASSVYQYYNVSGGWDNDVFVPWGSTPIASGQIPSNGLHTQWFKVDYGSSRVAAGYEFKIAGQNHATKWEFQGSNNNSTWTVLDSRDMGDPWNFLGNGLQDDSISFYFDNTVAYRYYRWVFQRLNSWTNWSGQKLYRDSYAFADFDIYVKSTDFTVLVNGNVGVGTNNPTQKLHVNGNIVASGTITPDYVFEHYFDGESKLKTDYKLSPLEQTIDFAKKHKHLPGIPSFEEIKKQGGILLNEANEKNLEKIEELYIHIYELSKEIKQLQQSLKD